MIAITLPWPSRSLHPNARVHWSKRAKAAKLCRRDAHISIFSAGIRRGDPDLPKALKVTCIFAPPDRRKRDADGMLSSIKSYLDGISDATGIDDSKFEISIRREWPIKGGAVRIELESA